MARLVVIPRVNPQIQLCSNGTLKLGFLKLELQVIQNHHGWVKSNLEDVLIARQELEVSE